jgi:hypothetical protein
VTDSDFFFHPDFILQDFFAPMLRLPKGFFRPASEEFSGLSMEMMP